MVNKVLEKQPYKYVIVDDDEIDCIALKHFLKDYINLQHLASFSSPDKCLDFIRNNEVDVLFLDIQMKGMNGFQLLEKVKDRIKCVVFTTSYMEFASDGFQVDALDYIVKPYSEERIEKCVKKIDAFMGITMKADIFDQTFSQDTQLVKDGKEQIYIKTYEILYLEALKDYTKLITLNKNKKSIIIHGNIGKLLESDDFRDFIRIHKSFAINKQLILSVSSKHIVLSNNVKIPVGRSYRKNIQETLLS